MKLRHLLPALIAWSALPFAANAQSSDADGARLSLELNAAQDVGQACRLSFLITNETGRAIDKAVFETVIFDTQGSVIKLSLFDFRDLPQDRPRVRQFDLPDRPCATVGRVLINGASSCVTGGSESDLCNSTLSVTSRLEMELLG